MLLKYDADVYRVDGGRRRLGQESVRDSLGVVPGIPPADVYGQLLQSTVSVRGGKIPASIKLKRLAWKTGI